MTITHYDLFAGIGGFSLALEEVFPDAAVRHIFCEWESFPTSVLRQHWPNGEFWGDIAELVSHTDTKHKGLEGGGIKGPGHTGLTGGKGADQAPDGFTIVTGGFPCQPFSHAGRRKGTADDRYQWPNMFAVIQNTRPEWVIAENVRGLVTWNEGMVLETVCADLESEGYEVRSFIIPAVAVGAPHRRDRVWIIANRSSQRSDEGQPVAGGNSETAHTGLTGRDNYAEAVAKPSAYADSQRVSDGPGQVQGTDGKIPERHDHAEPGDTGGHAVTSKHQQGSAGKLTSNDADTGPQRRGEGSGESLRPQSQEPERQDRQYPDWSRNWQEVAFATCDDAVDDGLSRLVDGVPYSRAKWRKNSLKAYGNGIVPEVAMNILQAIKETQETTV